MNSQQISLARSLLAAPQWKWKVGMVLEHHRPNRKATLWGVVGFEDLEPDCDLDWIDAYCLPDLTHPATAGILFDMLISIDPCMEMGRYNLVEKAPYWVQSGFVCWNGDTIAEVCGHALMERWEDES